MKNRLYGVLLTISLSALMMMLFFGEILKSPGDFYFENKGHGLTTYYGALFHARFDPQSYRSNAMNYPYGEAISFTDSQPLLVNPIRFISKHIVDITDHTVAIINLAMLFSIVLASLFIYLIFKEMGVKWWFASLAAVGIAMISPQIGRMGGHFGLSWLFWIPMVAYFIIRFDRTRKLPYTLLIGIVTWCAGMMHFYFVAIIAFLIGGYWLFRFFWYRKAKTFWYRDAIHIFIQFVFPLLIVQFTTMLNDDVTDRTAWPYGLFAYLAHPVGIFLPDKKPWLFVSQHITVFRHISWESLAYIGTPALIGFFAGLVWMVRKSVSKQSLLKVTHLTSLNVMFWVSLIVLLFSFGLPMVLGMKGLADYIGPLRQLRALARFSWLFFYLFNIIVFAAIYIKAFQGEAKWFWKVIAGCAFILLYVDGFYNIRNVANVVKNRIPEMEDRQNLTEANLWVNHIQSDNYQAIIPLPYFHVGSENIWIVAEHGVKEATMIASLKTGLPTVGVELSRTSISQTYHNYALFTEPLERLEFPDFLPDERPFVLLVMNGYQPNEQEQRLIGNSQVITESPRFKLYDLPVSVLRRLNLLYKDEVFERYNEAGTVEPNGWQKTITEAFFVTETFDDQPSGVTFNGNGALSYPARQWQTVWHDTLTGVPSGTTLLVSFWVKNYRNDGYLRTNIEFYLKNPANDQTTTYIYSDFFRYIKAFSGDWALIEFPFETQNDSEIAKFSIRNGVLPKAGFAIDELMIREQGLDVFRRDDRWLWYNNRRVVVR
jgi:hypothetical protein